MEPWANRLIPLVDAMNPPQLVPDEMLEAIKDAIIDVCPPWLVSTFFVIAQIFHFVTCECFRDAPERMRDDESIEGVRALADFCHGRGAMRLHLLGVIVAITILICSIRWNEQ